MVLGFWSGRSRAALLWVCLMLSLLGVGRVALSADDTGGGGGGLFDDITKPVDPAPNGVIPPPAVVNKLVEKPVENAPPDRLPAEPPAAAQAAAEKLVQEVFKADLAKKTPVDRLILARKLIGQGMDTRDDAAARFVCFRLARDLAIAAGDIPLAVSAIDQLVTFFAVDGFELRLKTLTMAGIGNLSPATHETITELALAMLDTAVAADEYPQAQRLAALIDGCAVKTHRTDFVTYARYRLRQMNNLRLDYDRIRQAMAMLQQNPDQPEACDVVGRYFAFGKGDWAKGLPFLVKSPDSAVAALARKELALPAEAKDQLELADGWWTVAEKNILCKLVVMQHAAEWYHSAMPSLSGIHLARVNGRLETLGRLSVEHNPAVNLLALVDPAKDARHGLWMLQDGALLCDNTLNACLQFPYTPPDEFDFRISFTRLDGTHEVAQIMPNSASGESFAWCMGALNNNVFGFSMLDKHPCDSNTSTVKVATALANGQRYTALVQVRHDGVKAYLDGQLMAYIKGDLKNLTAEPRYALGDIGALAIGANAATTVFHIIELVEVDGKGKRGR